MADQRYCAFISGASGGIGTALVKEFARQGYDLVAHARKSNPEFESFLSATASEHKVSVQPIYFDLTDRKAMTAAVKDLLKSKCYPSVLVNNAGVAYGGLFQMTSISTIEQVFDVNLFSSMRLTQLLLKGLCRNERGAIVNVSSIAGIDLLPGNSAYGVSKAALIAWTKTLAAELGACGVRVNAVAPGLTDTVMSTLMEEKAGKDMLESSAMGRKATPEEIASVVAFLASDAAAFVNGQVVRIDGGGVLWVRREQKTDSEDEDFRRQR